MKFAFFGYRGWAEEIFNNLVDNENIDSYTIKNGEYSKPINILKSPTSFEDIDFNEYSASFFYGWSWMVPQELVKNNDCICLHPSPLPKYRGGSPIQHQIINGETESAVSIFKMSDKLDNGPIYYQKPFSLEGKLSDIFSRISSTGAELTNKLINDYKSDNINLEYQNEDSATTYKRRKPQESELTKDMINSMNDRNIYDFVRALQPPYPQVYIKDEKGFKHYLSLDQLKLP